MATALLVFCRLRRVIRSSRATRIREDQDVLVAIHERLSLRRITAGRAFLDEERAIA